MTQVKNTDIICDGLLLGNVDVTDEAQAELAQKLLEQDMRRQFPELFINIAPSS